jgi:hypothetical protein
MNTLEKMVVAKHKGHHILGTPSTILKCLKNTDTLAHARATYVLITSRL